MTVESQNKDAEDPIKLKEEERPSKFLRLVTVSAYIFSVSFAALSLSMYYIFIWSKFNFLHIFMDSKFTSAINSQARKENTPAD